MKTERERRLEAALRTISKIDQFSREWLMSNPPQHAHCYAAKRIAREALADEGSGGGDFHPYDPRSKEAQRGEAIVSRLVQNAPPQQRDALSDALRRLERWDDDSYCDSPHARWADVGAVRRALTEPAVPDGFCSNCGEPFIHDIDEPFASCACGTTEWPIADWNSPDVPLVMKAQKIAYARGCATPPTVPEAVRRLPPKWRGDANWYDYKWQEQQSGCYHNQAYTVRMLADELDRAIAQGGEGRIPERIRQECTDLAEILDSLHSRTSATIYGTVQEVVDRLRDLAAAPEPGPEKDDE